VGTHTPSGSREPRSTDKMVLLQKSNTRTMGGKVLACLCEGTPSCFASPPPRVWRGDAPPRSLLAAHNAPRQAQRHHRWCWQKPQESLTWSCFAGKSLKLRGRGQHRLVPLARAEPRCHCGFRIATSPNEHQARRATASSCHGCPVSGREGPSSSACLRCPWIDALWAPKMQPSRRRPGRLSPFGVEPRTQWSQALLLPICATLSECGPR